MISYIASYKYVEHIENVVEKSGRSVFDKKVVTEIDIEEYVRQNLDQLRNVEIFIIDLSALKNADNEIINALNSYRLLYDQARIIFIAPNRSKGDRLLSEIFCMGIYDIIADIEDQELLEEELAYCLSNGKSYRESLIYKETSYNTTTEISKPAIKERIIIKNEIRTSVNKAFIGFMGTQSRIGVTHNAIVCANYLKNKGFKIAVVESDTVKNKSFDYIRESFDLDDSEEYFNLNQIDYYPSYNIKNIFNILSKNYNFILIDFGEFDKENLAEFNRCVMPIIISGSKPWEIDQINKIFECIPEEHLKEYTYLFSFTDTQDQANIKEGMGTLKKVFFSDYTPDPFNCSGSNELDNLFSEYIPETITQTKKKGQINVKEMLKDFKWNLKFSK